MNDDVDIADLVSVDPRIAKYVVDGLYDFSTPEASRLYTAAVLQQRYSFKIELSDENLCPTVPSRLLYVRYLHELAHCSEIDKPLVGVDVGTGHVAIYPLLACGEYQDWSFVGTEINQKSLEHAKSTVAANNLGDRITLLKSDGSIFPPRILSEGKQYVTMCNPPFYSSEGEMEQRSLLKDNERNIPVAIREELITEGGEVGFVNRMIEESAQYKNVRWFTSMLGKLESVASVVESLRERGINNYAIHELVPGKSYASTRRWVVGWSFHPQRPTNALCLCQSAKLRRFNPPHPQIVLPVCSTKDAVLEAVKKLGIVTIADSIRIELRGDVWSRSYRRRPNRDFDKRESLTVEISAGESLTVYWQKGYHYKTFESFIGWLKNSITS